jgi:hypothetical protein
VDVAELMPRHSTESRLFGGGLQHIAQQMELVSDITLVLVAGLAGGFLA